MFDRNQYKKLLMDSSIPYSEDQINRILDGTEANHTNMKQGPNVIHLEYYSSVLSDNDIQEIEAQLSSLDLELSRFNKTGLIYNSLSDFSLDVFFTLQEPIVKLIAEGFAVNIAWESIKYLFISTLNRIKSNIQDNKKPKYGLRMKFKDNKLIDFRLDNIESPEMLSLALDKATEFIKEEREPKDTILLSDYCEFVLEKEDWEAIDRMAEWKKKADEQAIAREEKRKKDQYGNT